MLSLAFLRCVSFLVRGESPPWSAAVDALQTCLGLEWTIFGGQATSPAESGHLWGFAKSGALPILLHPLQWGRSGVLMPSMMEVRS